jgi:hypothetical protein
MLSVVILSVVMLNAFMLNVMSPIEKSVHYLKASKHCHRLVSLQIGCDFTFIYIIYQV